MQPRATESIRIPQEFAEWAVAAARQQYDDLLGTGVDIVGRAEDLLPEDDPLTGPLEVGEDAVAAAAVATLADLAQQHYDEVQAHRRRIDALVSERDRLRRKVRTLRQDAPSAAGNGEPARRGPRGWLRRIVGR
jgi:hypothetical protein